MSSLSCSRLSSSTGACGLAQKSLPALESVSLMVFHCAYRIVADLMSGAIQSTLPIFITEWAPVNIRGAMILAYGIWNVSVSPVLFRIIS